MESRSSVVADRQSSLRKAYVDSPDTAISVKRVRTVETASTDAWHGTVTSLSHDGASWDYGIDDTVGGYDDLPNPGHLLCAALAACIESTTRMVANHLRVEIEHLEVEVVGDVDVRGCLAIEPSVRPGFRKLRCEVRLRPAAGTDERRLRRVLDQAEMLCVTLDTIRNGVPVEVLAEVEASAGSAA